MYVMSLYYVQTECLIVNGVKNRFEVTVQFKHEGTFHSGHRLHSGLEEEINKNKKYTPTKKDKHFFLYNKCSETTVIYIRQ
jgi:hypothetical protein